MTGRQTMPQQWLIAHERLGGDLWTALASLPRGNGVIVLRKLGAAERRRLDRLARMRRLIVVEGSTAARVHNLRELTGAMLRRSSMILISPLHETRSHPEWKPLSRMRAATLARLGGRRAIALGGMNRRRYAKIAALGFIGWAGIDAFRT